MRHEGATVKDTEGKRQEKQCGRHWEALSLLGADDQEKAFCMLLTTVVITGQIFLSFYIYYLLEFSRSTFAYFYIAHQQKQKMPRLYATFDLRLLLKPRSQGRRWLLIC